MQEDLNELYRMLLEEWVECCVMLDTLKKLYAPENNILLDDSLRFFKVMEKAFMERLVMQICRLFDPLESRGNKNFSLDFILFQYEQGQEKKRAEKARELKDGYSSSLKRIKKIRDKVISHNDKKSFIKRSRNPLLSTNEEYYLDDPNHSFEDIVYDCLPKILNTLRFREGELSGKVISSSYSQFYEILVSGVFFNSTLKTDQDLWQQKIKWAASNIK